MCEKLSEGPYSQENEPIWRFLRIQFVDLNLSPQD